MSQKFNHRPLNSAALNELALNYVGRFATSRARLIQYLRRKISERGWAAEESPDVDAVADRLVDYGYVDDAAFAQMKARGLARRGYGARRVEQALRAAGIAEQERAEVQQTLDDNTARQAALLFARRRRFGPYAKDAPEDAKARERIIAAFVRAGHDANLARSIIALAPGADVGAWLEDSQ